MPFPPSQERLGTTEAGAAGRRPVEEAQTARAAPRGEPWHPPLPVWLFLLLQVASLTLYNFFWIASLAGDIRRHLDPEARAWRYVLGYIFGVLHPFIVFKLGRHVASLNARFGRTVGPPLWVPVALAVVNIPAHVVIWTLAFEDQFLRDILVFAVLLLLLSLPWLLLQRQINVFKAQLQEVAWTARPQRLAVPHYFVLSFGLLYWGFMAAVALFEDYDFDPLPPPLPAGIALVPQTEVRGDSGLYALSVPGPGWRWLPKGSLAEDADLELAGPGADIWLVVYVAPAGDRRLDDIVDFRRRTLREAARSIEIEEVRRLLGESMVPVSYARYETESAPFGTFETYWVATTVHGEAAVIEVIGWTAQDDPGAAAVERLVESLTLLEEEVTE